MRRSRGVRQRRRFGRERIHHGQHGHIVVVLLMVQMLMLVGGRHGRVGYQRNVADERGTRGVRVVDRRRRQRVSADCTRHQTIVIVNSRWRFKKLKYFLV